MNYQITWERYHLHDVNILQDLYDPESPRKVLKHDSVLSIRVNPSGELHFFNFLLQIRGNTILKAVNIILINS
jgi:hypothetical protein